MSSLSDVLNDLAGGRVASLTDLTPIPATLTEFDVFLERDDILASLNRQYRYARTQHDAVRKEHGPDSPMAEIAADTEDSAWCAMQTRLMELRSDGGLMRSVQKVVRDAAEAEDQARQADKDKRALALFNKLELARIVREQNKSSFLYGWIVLVLYERYFRLPFAAASMPERIAA